MRSLILKLACFAEAIFLALEDSLAFAHIEESVGHDLHDVDPFCKVVVLGYGLTITQVLGFVIQLVVKFCGFYTSAQMFCSPDNWIAHLVHLFQRKNLLIIVVRMLPFP